MEKTKSNSDDLKLVIKRVFDAPRHLVFEAWTKPEHMKHWMAPPTYKIIFNEGELRPGGAWKSCMVSKDGEKLPVGGVYQEIVQDELLVFTHAWDGDDGKPEHETTVTVRFVDLDGKTEMTMTQQFFASVQSRDGHNGGWSQCFDLLAGLLETLKNKE